MRSYSPLTATGGGYYTIRNAQSGLYLNVTAASVADGAKVIQWTAQPEHPGDDQWMPVENADGTYSFFNLKSQKVLDDIGGSTDAGNQFGQ